MSYGQKLHSVLVLYATDACAYKLWCAGIQKPDHATRVHWLACDISSCLASSRWG